MNGISPTPETSPEPVYLVEATVMVKLRFSMKRSDVPNSPDRDALEAHCLQLCESLPARFIDQDNIRVAGMIMREAQIQTVPENDG